MSLTKKPKMLVVDDEPDNLDLLYRTFRREFNVLRADSGVAALDVLRAEGEVAVIISDQRMPEMKGTEFLSKTVPEFPDTMRIILTGFTDVEDLVEAINSGQVYKYITKPWDPSELKSVVQRAAEVYELLKQRAEESRRAQAQTNLLSAISDVAQSCSKPGDCLLPLATAFANSLAPTVCLVQLVDGDALGAAGIYGHDNPKSWLGDDPLTKRAIATKTLQACQDVSANGDLSAVPAYQTAGVKSHLVAPIVYRDRVLAVVSVQWSQPRASLSDEAGLVSLCAQQAALALVCTASIS